MPRVPHSTLAKSCSALAYALRSPRRLVGAAQRGLAEILRERVRTESPLLEATLAELLDGATPAVELVDFEGRTGNVTLRELTVLAAMVRARGSKRILEIGTFDGNTALQLARNAPADAHVYTLDLPAAARAAGALEPEELRYVHDPDKQRQRRFEDPRHGVADKVTQLLGDSATFDFAALREEVGAFDFVFVDGSHSAEYVRNDTARVLPILTPDAVVFWHDYKPAWPGVIHELDRLGAELGLRRVQGTSLVCMARPAHSVPSTEASSLVGAV